ncbi:hypothetical protein NSB20_19480 [Bacteroides acidifaciens]|uniref:hypothetical protein n=1 Tax=Bacteroides acidifaciens TaxID=85831 RepID=UPI00214A5C8B|nr:hypothetical protein [Bacteroides acidifaciens]MCR2007648.1 hypothetical protein [Bacteroides acidifaciens]
MSWKKMIIGEKMPDKDDPKYRKRYENEVEAGRKAARVLKIDKAASGVQRFACKHPKWFLAIVFTIVVGCLTFNIYRMVAVRRMQKTEQHATATEQQEKLLKQKLHRNDHR